MDKKKLKGKDLELVNKIEKEVNGAEFVRLSGGFESERCFEFRLKRESEQSKFFDESGRISVEIYGEDAIENEILLTK